MKDCLTYRRMFGAISSATILALSLWINPTLAQDPFRTSNQREIGGNTEAAFKAMFKEGNYLTADRYLQQAVSSEPKEPLTYALKASLDYTLKQDLKSLDTYGEKTLDTATQLITTDPLRGNLYAAVGHFLQGAAILLKEGTIKGTPGALGKLRQVYEHLDKAEAVSANDPELNLVRGYMDLMLAVNLPFSNPQQAINRLEKFASPEYLADRGLAIGYRDLKQYPEALKAVNLALKATASNPELFYLKAQILAEQGRKQNDQAILKDAITHFDKAMAKKNQLPADLVKQIERERNKTAKRLSPSGK